MHVAVLLQHYHTPDCPTAARPWSLVRALARRHEVTLLTTDAWCKRRLTHRFEWVPPGVQMRALPVPYANDMATARRLRSYLGYAARALWNGSLRMPPPDLVYASSTPLTVGAAGAALAARWGCPWVFEVRDLWPDFPVQMGAFDGHPLLQRAAYALERGLYRRSAHVVAASPGMAARVRRLASSENVSAVPYGTDLEILEQVAAEDEAALRRALDLEAGRPVVCYAGSFGRANDLPTLARAARRLLERRPEARFVFAGRGYHRPLVERAAQELPNVRLLRPQAYPRSLALFRLADVSVVSFLDRPVLATNAPSKLFDSLSAGTPVVVTRPGWTKTLVEEHRCGWHVPAEQPEALAHCLGRVLGARRELQAAGQRARRTAHARFDRRVHMSKILSIIEKVKR